MRTSDRRWMLLHGTPLTPQVWEPVARILRGLGRVECPNVTPQPGDARPQVDIAGRLAEQLLHPTTDFDSRANTAGWHLVGHSFGGQVALELALAAPSRIASLTVLCSRDSPFPPFGPAARALRAGQPVDVDAALTRWFRPAELTSRPDVVGYARRCLQDADRPAWAQALDAIATYDRTEHVAAITVPTTLVAAEHDPVSTPAAMADLAARMPDAELVVQRGAAHMSPFLDPSALADVLVRAQEHEPWAMRPPGTRRIRQPRQRNRSQPC